MIKDNDDAERAIDLHRDAVRKLKHIWTKCTNWRRKMFTAYASYRFRWWRAYTSELETKLSICTNGTKKGK